MTKEKLLAEALLLVVFRSSQGPGKPLGQTQCRPCKRTMKNHDASPGIPRLPNPAQNACAAPCFYLKQTRSAFLGPPISSPHNVLFLSNLCTILCITSTAAPSLVLQPLCRLPSSSDDRVSLFAKAAQIKLAVCQSGSGQAGHDSGRVGREMPMGRRPSINNPPKLKPSIARESRNIGRLLPGRVWVMDSMMRKRRSRQDQMLTPSRWRTLDLSARKRERYSMMPRAIASKSFTLLARKP
jgi:hypothetical protein